MEMPLRIYTPYLDMTGEIDGYSSAQLERNYHDVGEVEIHVNLHAHNADKIQQGSIISLGDSESKAMFVRHMEIELTEEGKQSEEWTIRGPTLQGLMKQGLTVPPKGKSHDRKSGSAETVMKHYVKQCLVDPVDKDKKIKELLIAPDKERGEHVSHESRYKKLSDELANISKESGLGWIIYIDYTRHKFVFDVVDGLDLSQDNEEGYDPVFFSPDFGTIKQQSFSDSDLDMANVAYVGGPGEGADRKIVVVGDATGMNRHEMFVDARDIGSKSEDDDGEEEEMTDEEIEGAMVKRGKEKLEEQANELSLDAEILSPTTREAYEWKHDGYLQPIQPYGHYERKEQQVTPFVYERDFDLGDTVPVYNRKWGITMTARITKIKEIHEPGGFRLDATFGKERPTLVSKIRDNFNELNGIEKQEIAAQLVKKESKLRDDKLTQEQLDRIKQAKDNLKEAKDYTYDRDTIDDKDKKIADDAKRDAKEKANAAQSAAEKLAEAKAELAETQAKAHADGKISDEEKRAIQDAKDKLEEAKQDAKEKADKAESSAREYAELKSKEAQEAAEKVADAKAKLAETEAKAHADDEISKEQKARIDQAEADLEEAKAAAELAETQAKAYSDGKLSDEEKRAIKDAEDKLAEAKKHADEADKKVEENAKKHTEDYSEQKVHVGDSEPDDKNKKWLDTSGSHDKWRRYNHDASDNDNVDVKWPTTDVIDKDTTFANEWLVAKHIESLNGLTVANGQLQITEDGHLKTSGDITGSTGTFDDIAVKEGDFTLITDRQGNRYSIVPNTNIILDHSYEMIQVSSTPENIDKVKSVNSGEPPFFSVIRSEIWGEKNNPLIHKDVLSKTEAIFGNNSAVVNLDNYFYQNHLNLKPDTTYTLSAHFKNSRKGEPGKPMMLVYVKRVVDGGENEMEWSKEFKSDEAVSSEAVRHAFTFTTPDLNFDGEDYYLGVDIKSTDDKYVMVDGVELVESNIAGMYKEQSDLYSFLNGHGEAFSINTRELYVSDGNFDRSLSAEHMSTKKIIADKAANLEELKFKNGRGSDAIVRTFQGSGREVLALYSADNAEDYGSSLKLYGNGDSDNNYKEGFKLASGGGNAFVRSMDHEIQLKAHGTDGLTIRTDSSGAQIFSKDIYNRSSGGSANVHITSYGTLARSSSASKYKLDIEKIKTEGYAEKILNLHPVKWYDKADIENMHCEYQNKKYKGEDVGHGFEDMQYLESCYGLKAEDVVDAGLTEYVTYGMPDDDGNREIEGIEYDRLWTLLIPLVKEQRDRTDELEKENKDLKARLEKLEKAINAN